jgi:hypothetical protein
MDGIDFFFGDGGGMNETGPPGAQPGGGAIGMALMAADMSMEHAITRVAPP